MNGEYLKRLRGELWIILPFFIFALYLFLGSFQYKIEAGIVPKLLGFAIVILSGMRLFHIIFPNSRIGRFKEAGLAGEFDSIKEAIKEGRLKGQYEQEVGKNITFIEERKAFIALIGSCITFVLFGYLIGSFFVIIGISYYYGFKRKIPLLVTLASTYFVVYILLYKMLQAPGDFGLVLEPILNLFNLI